MYKTVLSGYLSFMSIPIECAKCVLPKPTPPNMSNGLNDVPPGLLATAIPAFLANLFESPSKKFSKV